MRVTPATGGRRETPLRLGQQPKMGEYIVRSGRGGDNNLSCLYCTLQLPCEGGKTVITNPFL